MENSKTFTGTIRLQPPLNQDERQLLERLASEDDYEDGPSPRCHWIPSPPGDGLTWDGEPDASEPAAWLRYLINHFLKPNAHRSRLPGYGRFTFDHYANGVVTVREEGREWLIVALDNDVTTLPSA